MPRGISIVAQPKGPNKRAQLLDMQAVLFRIVTGAIRQFDARGEVIDVPAREIAMCAKAYRELEQQLRVMSGIAPLAPVKAEPKSRRRAPVVMHPDDMPASVVTPPPGVVESPGSATIASPPTAPHELPHPGE